MRDDLARQLDLLHVAAQDRLQLLEKCYSAGREIKQYILDDELENCIDLQHRSQNLMESIDDVSCTIARLKDTIIHISGISYIDYDDLIAKYSPEIKSLEHEKDKSIERLMEQMDEIDAITLTRQKKLHKDIEDLTAIIRIGVQKKLLSE